MQIKKYKKMMKDTVQIITANAGAIGISLANVNDILTFISLGLAITFTVSKFMNTKKK